MTTLAYDGSCICSDSMGIGDFICQYPFQKIVTFTEGPYAAIACTGTFNNQNKFMDWVQNGGDIPSFQSDDSVSAMAVDRNGKVFCFFSGCHDREEVRAYPNAEGSGSRFAMGAMMAGATAFRAVEIASQLDPNTGGEVQCYNIETGELTGPFRQT